MHCTDIRVSVETHIKLYVQLMGAEAQCSKLPKSGACGWKGLLAGVVAGDRAFVRAFHQQTGAGWLASGECFAGKSFLVKFHRATGKRCIKVLKRLTWTWLGKRARCGGSRARGREARGLAQARAQRKPKVLLPPLDEGVWKPEALGSDAKPRESRRESRCGG